VEGQFTTEDKVHSIRLTSTAVFGSIFSPGGNIVGIEEATVIIRNDRGENTFLVDAGNGYYETDGNIAAEVGSSYTLLIELPNGESYVSLPETVLPVAVIDSLTYEFKEQPRGNDLSPDTGVEVRVHFRDNNERRDFYLWKSEGLYEFLTFPSLFTIPADPDSGIVDPIPAPKSCCATCWRSEDFVTPLAEGDRFFNGNAYERTVLFLRDDGLRFFNDKYLVKVMQHSISAEAFDFIELVQNQISIDGDIFDPPPATITGNFISVDNPNKTVIGYFWVADVSVDSIFVFSEDLAVVLPQTVIKDDCRETAGTTTTMPVFW